MRSSQQDGSDISKKAINGEREMVEVAIYKE